MSIDRLSAGDLLIAPPGMADEQFENAVIMLVHHDVYSVGFCINQPSEYTANQLLESMQLDQDCPMFWGGPQNTGTVWMLHDPSWTCKASVSVTKDWSMTSHTEMFEALNSENYPDRYVMLYGGCIWAPGQLEGELAGIRPWSARNSWLILQDPDPRWLVECDPDDMWAQATILAGKQAVDTWIP